jgi:hypothetical protein
VRKDWAAANTSGGTGEVPGSSVMLVAGILLSRCFEDFSCRICGEMAVTNRTLCENQTSQANLYVVDDWASRNEGDTCAGAVRRKEEVGGDLRQDSRKSELLTLP